MRSVALVFLMAVLAAAAGVVLTRPHANAVAMTPAASEAAVSADGATVAPLQEGPRVTVRVGAGRENVRIGPSVEQRGRKGRVENPGLGRQGGRSMLSVEGQGVSMAEEGTSGEGLLTRIHVDADEDLIAVIGFYTTIDSDQAVNRPDTYSCKRCSGVLVCGVDPQCAN